MTSIMFHVPMIQGVELALAYQRLGAQVLLIGDPLLPRDEPEARLLLASVFKTEGIRHFAGRATAAQMEHDQILIRLKDTVVSGDTLLVATGRTPTVDGLNLEKAGIE